MFEVSLALIIILLVLWLGWRWRRTSIFSNLGIPGPKPNLLFGNLLELYIKGPIICHEEWVKKYGRIVGYYYGMKPILLIADAQLLKNVFIKDFQKFTDREPFNPLLNPLKLEKYTQSVLNLRGQKWKEIRSVLTPSFSTAKMKQTVFIMSASIDHMISILDKKADSGEIVELMDVYQRLTMDVISKSSFGIVTDIQTDPKSWMLRAAQLMFQTPYRDPLIFLGVTFPWMSRLAGKLQSIILWFMNGGTSPLWALRGGLHKVLEHRKNQKERGNRDLLQLMIESKVKIDTGVDVRHLEVGSDEDNKEQDSTESKVTRTMSDKEIIASAFTVFLAGYETTSTALGYTSYLLAKYPDVQEKLYEEINELIKSGEKLEYGTIGKLSYLDKVFNESLRVFPPVYLFTNRFAGVDVHYGSLKIPKDMIVQAPVYLMHHDTDYWTDPEKFDPERFNSNPNSDGIIFLPFGVGPRNCLGMRFAQMEAKLALAHMVNHFRIILPESEKKKKLATTQRIRTLSPTHGVNVKLEKRKKIH